MKIKFFYGIESKTFCCYNNTNFHITKKPCDENVAAVNKNNNKKTDCLTVLENPYAEMPRKKFSFNKLFHRGAGTNKDEGININADQEGFLKENNNNNTKNRRQSNTSYRHSNTSCRQYMSETNLTELEKPRRKKYSFFRHKKNQQKKEKKQRDTKKQQKAPACEEQSTSSEPHRDSIQPHAIMFYAVQYKELELLERVVYASTDININDLNEDGIAVIHFAAMSGSTACIETLVSLGADIDLKDIRGNPPLHYALLMKQFQFAGELLKRGAQSVLLSSQQFPELKDNNKRISWST